jgi:hypothetical protein
MNTPNRLLRMEAPMPFEHIAEYGKQHLGWKPGTKFRVIQTVTMHYDVVADTPEDAAQVVREGDADDGECYDSDIDRVVLGSTDFAGPDLRSDHPCTHCGTIIPARFTLTTCNDCFMTRVRARMTPGAA